MRRLADGLDWVLLGLVIVFLDFRRGGPDLLFDPLGFAVAVWGVALLTGPPAFRAPHLRPWLLAAVILFAAAAFAGAPASLANAPWDTAPASEAAQGGLQGLGAASLLWALARHADGFGANDLAASGRNAAVANLALLVLAPLPVLGVTAGAVGSGAASVVLVTVLAGFAVFLYTLLVLTRFRALPPHPPGGRQLVHA